MIQHSFNPSLMECAVWALEKAASEKTAFLASQPQGGDPAAAAQQQPAAAAAPPQMPFDAQSAMAGDPAAQGAAPAAASPPPPPAFDPNAIRTMIREELAQAQGGGAGASPGGGGEAGKKPKAAKIEPERLMEELSRVRKMVTHLSNSLGAGMPSDILDDDPKPPEGEQGAAPAQGGAPASPPPPTPGAIPPIAPVQGAYPTPAPPKTASVSEGADALWHLIRNRR